MIILFVIDWIGFFQGSTTIIDTSMFGQIDLEITLAGSGILLLGKLTENADLAAVTAANSEIGIAIPAAVKVGAALAAEGTSYKLTDVNFNMVRYDLPKAVTDAMTAV